MAGINTTKKEVNQTAEKHLEEKLSFEKKLMKDLHTFFEQLADDYEVIYAGTGKVLTLTESYEEELSSLLKKNYRNIAGEFSSLTRKALDEEIDFDLYEIIPEEESKLKEAIALAIGAYILLRSKDITPKIASTAQDVLKNKTDAYIIDQARKGNAVTQAQIASNVAKEIKTWSKNHAPVIAITEVQTLAEKSKIIENTQVKASVEAEKERLLAGGVVQKDKKKPIPPEQLTKEQIKEQREILEIANSVDIQKGSRKVWITSGDEKVRPSHSFLDGRSVEQNELFTTGNGSRMMYAGDMENGASLDDVINCRCIVVYKYNTEIVKLYRNSMYRRK